MATTSNLNLPLIPDNAVNNVKRDMNALAEAVDTAVTEKVNEANSVAEAAQTTANAANLAAAAAQTKADQAFQLGNERKQEVVDALIALGVSASMADSWDTLLAKMSAIIKATGNATAVDVLAGKTFSNAAGNNIVGSMPNQGSKFATLTQQDQQYTIPAGKHDGTGKITASFANLIAVNIKKDVVVGGVKGELQPGGFMTLDYRPSWQSTPAGSSYELITQFPAGVSKLIFHSKLFGSSSSYSSLQVNSAQVSIDLVIGSGTTYNTDIATITFANPSTYNYIFSFEVDFINKFIRVVSYNNSSQRWSVSEVAIGYIGYNPALPIKLQCFRVNSGSTVTTGHNISLYGDFFYI